MSTYVSSSPILSRSPTFIKKKVESNPIVSRTGTAAQTAISNATSKTSSSSSTVVLTGKQSSGRRSGSGSSSSSSQTKQQEVYTPTQQPQSVQPKQESQQPQKVNVKKIISEYDPTKAKVDITNYDINKGQGTNIYSEPTIRTSAQYAGTESKKLSSSISITDEISVSYPGIERYVRGISQSAKEKKVTKTVKEGKPIITITEGAPIITSSTQKIPVEGGFELRTTTTTETPITTITQTPITTTTTTTPAKFTSITEPVYKLTKKKPYTDKLQDNRPLLQIADEKVNQFKTKTEKWSNQLGLPKPINFKREKGANPFTASTMKLTKGGKQYKNPFQITPESFMTGKESQYEKESINSFVLTTASLGVEIGNRFSNIATEFESKPVTTYVTKIGIPLATGTVISGVSTFVAATSSIGAISVAGVGSLAGGVYLGSKAGSFTKFIKEGDTKSAGALIADTTIEAGSFTVGAALGKDIGGYGAYLWNIRSPNYIPLEQTGIKARKGMSETMSRKEYLKMVKGKDYKITNPEYQYELNKMMGKKSYTITHATQTPFLNKNGKTLLVADPSKAQPSRIHFKELNTYFALPDSKTGQTQFYLGYILGDGSGSSSKIKLSLLPSKPSVLIMENQVINMPKGSTELSASQFINTNPGKVFAATENLFGRSTESQVVIPAAFDSFKGTLLSSTKGALSGKFTYYSESSPSFFNSVFKGDVPTKINFQYGKIAGIGTGTSSKQSFWGKLFGTGEPTTIVSSPSPSIQITSVPIITSIPTSIISSTSSIASSSSMVSSKLPSLSSSSSSKFSSSTSSSLTSSSSSSFVSSLPSTTSSSSSSSSSSSVVSSLPSSSSSSSSFSSSITFVTGGAFRTPAPGFGYGSFGGRPFKIPKQPKAYTPSARAALFNIRGSPSSIGVKSGLGIRPIRELEKKKKKKVTIKKVKLKRQK